MQRHSLTACMSHLADVNPAPCQLRLRWAIQSVSQPTVQPRSRAKASLEMASRHAVAPFSFRCISANTHNRVPSLPGPHFWPHSAPWRRGVERGNTHRPWSRARGNRGCISAAPSTLFQPPGNYSAGFGSGVERALWRRSGRTRTVDFRLAGTGYGPPPVPSRVTFRPHWELAWGVAIRPFQPPS